MYHSHVRKSVAGALAMVTALALVGQAEAEPRQLRCTFEQCLARAKKQSPLLAAARLGLDQYESKLREAQSAWYPKFDISAFGTALPELKDGHDGSTPLQDYDFTKFGPLLVTSVSMGQTLFTFGKISTLKDMARQGVDIARVTGRIAEDEMRFQLARAWWGLVLVAELRDLVADGKRLMQEQREKIEKARDEGDASFNQADLAKLNVFSADIEEKVRQFDRSRGQAEDGVRLALGESTELAIEAAGELTPVVVPPLPMQQIETLALANSPRLLAQRGGVQVRLMQAQLARNQFLPDLVLVARYAYTYAPTRADTPDSLATNPNNSATSGLGLALRWSLDPMRQLEKIDQADLDAKQAALLEQGERAKLRMDVRQMYREMVDARAMIDVQERAFKSARGWLSAENQAYEDGFQEFAEVLRAMEAYTRRRMTYAESIFNYTLAVAALSRAVGMDLTQLAEPGH
ncbi:MAG: TolC family protein [Deltaproteobacteria bacterium]|nr:TolC family protein [Deltaproteobacteria bacterium]